ncbi:MAG: hypothetical protein AB1489_10500 [Acidobacteriota bacterium]
MLRKAICFVFLFPLLCSLSVSAQSLDEIINKNIQARGGLDKLKAVKSMKFTGKIRFQGLEAPLTLQFKRPNNARLEIVVQGKTIVQAYDGDTGWAIVPFTGSSDPEKMSEDDLKEIQEQADFDGPLIDYKAKGHTVELVGKEDLEGTSVYKLKVTLKTGDVRYLFIDAENYLELKTTSKQKRQGTEFEVDSYLGDYKEVNGILIPHAIENKTQGRVISQFTLEKIETNVAIEDTIFKMPAKSAQKEPAKP